MNVSVGYICMERKTRQIELAEKQKAAIKSVNKTTTAIGEQ